MMRPIFRRTVSCRSRSLISRFLCSAASPPSECPFHSSPTQVSSSIPVASTSSTTSTQTASSTTTSLKPLSSMPRSSGLSGLLSMMRGDPHKPYVVWKEINEEAGDLFYVDILGLKIVMSFNPDHVPVMIRSAGSTPAPLQILPWLHREREKKKKNPKHEVNTIALEGQEWRANRSVLDAVFSSIPRIQSYLPMVDEIAQDFVNVLKSNLLSIAKEKANNGDHNTIGENPQLYKDIYSYSNEVIGQVVYGQRLGNMSLQRTSLADEFNKDLCDLFVTMANLQMSVPFFLFFKTPKYRHFSKLLDKFEQYYSPKFLSNSDQWHKENKSTNRVDLISHMRNQGQNEERVLLNAITMFLGGSDSTSHTLMWLLYNLGRFPQAQETLRQEVDDLLPNKTPLHTDALHSMKYLRAVLKESMRLTPSVPGLMRVYDRPINLAGYEVPPGVLVSSMSYITNHKSEIFPDPATFKPERWLEVDRSKRPNPWANVPFGSGPRACQAFRLAELEAYVLMVKLVQNFKWKTLNTVEARADIFLKPDREVKIQWTVL